MFKKIIQLLIAWRLSLFLIAALAVFVLPAKDCCQTFGPNLSLNYLFQVWSNFAGQDFLDLAKFGYGYPLKLGTYLFFPFFPALIKQVTLFLPDYLTSAMFIVHTSLILALYFLYKLVRLDYKDDIAKASLLMLMISPAAFFFGAVYTESIFLLLVVLSLYLVRKNHIFLACLLALFASATRVAGIFLWPALIWEVWQNRKHSSLVWLLLPPIGILYYMRFLLTKVGDPLFFLKVSPDFGPNLIITKLILLHQVYYRYIRMLFLTKSPDITFFVVLVELLVGILFLALIIIAFKKLRPSYAIYMALTFLIPTLTGTFVGLPRYALTIFPGFILLAIWYTKQKPLAQRVYLGINLLFSFIFIVLFTRGYFVG